MNKCTHAPFKNPPFYCMGCKASFCKNCKCLCVRCPHCGGYGDRQWVLAERCEVPFVNCDTCNGTGKVEEEPKP